MNAYSDELNKINAKINDTQATSQSDISSLKASNAAVQQNANTAASAAYGAVPKKGLAETTKSKLYSGYLNETGINANASAKVDQTLDYQTVLAKTRQANQLLEVKTAESTNKLNELIAEIEKMAAIKSASYGSGSGSSGYYYVNATDNGGDSGASNNNANGTSQTGNKFNDSILKAADNRWFNTGTANVRWDMQEGGYDMQYLNDYLAKFSANHSGDTSDQAWNDARAYYSNLKKFTNLDATTLAEFEAKLESIMGI